MADGALLTIGELARLTGLTVKTVRFWSDAGLVPPADRTPAGYRLYAPGALMRLGLVRTLRDLGVDLATIRRVLADEVTIGEVAAAHAAALEVQIRALAAYARHTGRDDGPEFRSWLLELLEAGGRRYERYWQLLAIINGWPAAPSVMPAAEWLITALRTG